MRPWILIVFVAACMGCDAVTDPSVETLTTAELLILASQQSAPAVPAVSVHIVNSRVVTARLLHTDQFSSQFVEIRFPAGSIESVDGLAIGPRDSVLVQIVPRSGQYGMTISPSTIIFSAGNLPRATFTYAVYGDRSVANGSAKYPTRDAYSAALDVWEQATVDRWQRATNSSTPGSDEVSGSLSTGGMFLVAAPR